VRTEIPYRSPLSGDGAEPKEAKPRLWTRYASLERLRTMGVEARHLQGDLNRPLLPGPSTPEEEVSSPGRTPRLLLPKKDPREPG
jgi:hypothetical protein